MPGTHREDYVQRTFILGVLLSGLLVSTTHAGPIQASPAHASPAHASPPKGWLIAGSAPGNYDIGVTAGSRHPGDKNAFIRARTNSSGFGTLMQTISANAYHGKRVRLSGFLRTQDAGKAQLWMRVDGFARRIIGFDNMDDRALRGDNDWQRYAIVLDVPNDAADIAFGFLLSGNGEVLADGLRLETVGLDVPLTGLAGLPRPNAPVNLDFAQ
jgi:hypothetical protein